MYKTPEKNRTNKLTLLEILAHSQTEPSVTKLIKKWINNAPKMIDKLNKITSSLVL